MGIPRLGGASLNCQIITVKLITVKLRLSVTSSDATALWLLVSRIHLSSSLFVIIIVLSSRLMFSPVISDPVTSPCPHNQLISLTCGSPPISPPAAHLLIYSSVFILAHSHLFSARSSCVLQPNFPAFYLLLFCLTTVFDLITCRLDFGFPACSSSDLSAYCLITRYRPCLPVPRILITLPTV